MHVEHKTAVAGDGDHRFVGVRHFDAESGGITPAQSALVAGRDVGARLVDLELGAADIADLGQVIDKVAIIGEDAAHRLEESNLRRNRFGPRINFGFDIFHLLRARGATDAGRLEGADQLWHHLFTARDKTDRRLLYAVMLFWVNIDANHLELLIGAPTHQRAGDAAAQGHHDIGLFPELMAGGGADRQRVAAADNAVAATPGDDRRLQQFGQFEHRLGRVDRAGADKDQRIFGFAEQFDRFSQFVTVNRRVTLGQFDATQIHFGLGGEHIGRAFQPHGLWAAGLQLAERFGDQVGGIRRAFDALGPFGQSLKDADLVGDLVEQPIAFVDRIGLDLADEGEDACIGAIGRGEGRSGIEKARAGHHAKDPHLVAGERITKGHIGRALFMAGMDHAQFIAVVIKGVKEMVALHTGQPKDRIDAMCDQGLDNRLAPGYLCHNCSFNT